MNPVTPETAGDQFKVTVWLTTATPMPDSEMLDGELEALLLTVMLPAAAPLADGANVEVNVVDCPGARIIPLAPVELKPAPATSTCAMVTLEFPALVMVTFCVPVLDTFTFPKLRLLALELSNSVAAAETVSAALLLVAEPPRWSQSRRIARRYPQRGSWCGIGGCRRAAHGHAILLPLVRQRGRSCCRNRESSGLSRRYRRATAVC